MTWLDQYCDVADTTVGGNKASSDNNKTGIENSCKRR